MLTGTEVKKLTEVDILEKAAECGDLKNVSELLEIDAVLKDVTAHNNGALRLAAGGGHLLVVNRLLEIDSVLKNVTADNNDALYAAARGGHLLVVNRLLEIDSVLKDVTAYNNGALRAAAAGGHLLVVNRLLEIPAVLTKAERNMVLTDAAGGGHLSVVNRLLEIDFVLKNVTADNNEALRLAVGGGHLSVVNQLLKLPSVLEKIELGHEIILGVKDHYISRKIVGDHAALRDAIEKNHFVIIFRLLQVYQEATIVFPNIKVGDFVDLNKFFENYSVQFKSVQEVLENCLPASGPIKIVDEYLDSMFTICDSSTFTPAFLIKQKASVESSSDSLKTFNGPLTNKKGIR